MSFQEKSAWVMIVALVISGGLYLQGVLAASQALGGTAPPNIGLITFVTVVIIAFAIFGHVVAALSNLADANAPEDERDKRIAQRAGSISGLVLGFAVFVGIWHYVARPDGNLLFHILVMGLVVSQIAEYILSIWFYRRGV